MSSLHPSSVDTVNAAATAIVTADSRVQPTSLPKSGWGSWWSLYWCFGSYKHKTKRIGHAVLVPEPAAPTASAPAVSGTQQSRSSATIVFPFIAPPSSPASFLQSDPPSAARTPHGSLSLTAAISISDAFSTSAAASAFAIGPYAHETQLVTPPAFSAVTTEPSTACFTPPPESAPMTTPPSPEVPFAQLLTSSLARNRRSQMRFPLSQYDYQPYTCPGSPNSNHFSTRKWGSEAQTPTGWGSRLGSGAQTPTGWGSRLGSGAQTPNGGLSRLGSGAMTPNNGGEPPSRDNYYVLENQISEVASLANSDDDAESQGDNDKTTLHHRVSFELTGGEIPAMPPPHHHPTPAEPARPTGAPMSKDFDFDNVKPQVLSKAGVDCEWWTSVDFFPLQQQPKVS
ncbi:unnamed protein product [Cuscuta campestris]|uniref:Uncharacterized protein n=2 Tax=Cuscuta sect. Cleistogrammica TaxID=1824901 RepID=A0A484K6C5_9ASTE|nr:hypothetical protein DM860_015395 [Cuscuta australis]VFQ58299.1 unnamed protein product [Cuscuta campestris]